jgi:hypothetical protein
MDRDLLATIPAGVSAGLEDGGLPQWGTEGSVILATTASGTHGPGAGMNDSLTPSLRYVFVLMSRTDAGFLLYPDGSYAGPVPSSGVYRLYEESAGWVAPERTISIARPAAPPPPPPDPGAYLAQPITSAFWSYRQTATLWRLVATDSWGGQTTHEIAGLFLCDYAEEERRMVSARGDEFVTKLLLYTSLPGIKQGDMVLIGASGVADPYAAGAREVRAVATWADTFRPEGAPDFRIAT